MGEHSEQNAKLIITAVNSCAKINASNPQVVAENIEEMYNALKCILPERTGYMQSMNWADYNMAINGIKELLAKLEAK